MKTALYRHFDAMGVLLYVGIALSPVHRMMSHERRSHWAESIVNISIEWFATRHEARAAELRAIQTEGPLHNIDGKPGLPPRKPSRRPVKPPPKAAPMPRVKPVPLDAIQRAVYSIR